FSSSGSYTNHDQTVRIESQRWTGSRALEQRGIAMIAHQPVRDGGGEPVRDATGGNPEALAAGPSTVLDRSPASSAGDLDHRTGTNRRRSPGLKRAGGSA